MGITTGDVVGGEEHGILDEVGQGTQDEGHKEMHVDVVAGAVELPGGRGCRAVGARAGEAQGSAAHPPPTPTHHGNPGPGRDNSLNLPVCRT